MYSQYGQAEEILQLFEKLGYKTGTVFEAGAHSPNRISNSRPFLEDGWKAFLSESDHSCVNEWKSSNLNSFELDEIGIFSEPQGLNIVLERLRVPRNLNVLFLDIDGGEYELIRNLTYRPDVICVEYENTLPMFVSFAPKGIRPWVQGSSWSFFLMMKEKRYFYVKSYFGDLLFISEEFFVKNSLHSVMPFGFPAYLRYAATSGYNIAAVILNQKNGADGISFYESKLQILIEEGECNVAAIQFAYLCQAIHSLLSTMVVHKNPDYVKQATERFQRFLIEFPRKLDGRLY